MFSGRKFLEDELFDFYRRIGWHRVFDSDKCGGAVFIEVWQPAIAQGSRDPEHTHIHFFRIRNSTKEPDKIERVYVLRESDMKNFDKCYANFTKWHRAWSAPRSEEKFWAAQRRKCSARNYFDH